MLDALPYRGDGTGGGRTLGLALPPARMPLIHARRPLKRWRYVGVWAVWERGARRLHERTTFRTGPVALPDGAARVRDGAVTIELELEPTGDVVEVVSRHGRSYIWTRKTPVKARGAVTVDGTTIAVDAAGLVDDSAGYHARHTAWEWSAGVGMARDGTSLAWNLVRGVHDAATASERTVWIEGVAREVGPVVFAGDLGTVDELRFAAECERARREELLVFASDYRQPFGTFAGTPGRRRAGRGLRRDGAPSRALVKTF